MAVFIGAVWSVGRYKKLRRRESAATLVNDPEADAELRKKDDLAKNPSSTFERLPDCESTPLLMLSPLPRVYICS